MAKHRFTWLVHDDADDYDQIGEFVERGLPRDLAERLSPERPFYKVELDCEADDETLEVTITGARSTQRD